MTGGAHLVKPRILPSRIIIRLSILMKMILTISKDLGLLEINTRLPLEIVINIRPLDIEAP